MNKNDAASPKVGASVLWFFVCRFACCWLVRCDGWVRHRYCIIPWRLIHEYGSGRCLSLLFELLGGTLLSACTWSVCMYGCVCVFTSLRLADWLFGHVEMLFFLSTYTHFTTSVKATIRGRACSNDMNSWSGKGNRDNRSGPESRGVSAKRYISGMGIAKNVFRLPSRRSLCVAAVVISPDCSEHAMSDANASLPSPRLWPLDRLLIIVSQLVLRILLSCCFYCVMRLWAFLL